MSNVPVKISLIEQVKNLLKEEIASGVLKPGQRIESIRSLLKKYKVSHITAASALKQLSLEGWINSKVGSGSFVSAAPPLSGFRSGKAIISSRNIIYFIIMGGSSLEGYHSKVLEYLKELTAKYDLQLKFASADDAEILAKISSSPTTLAIIYPAEMKPFNQDITAISYGMSPVYHDSCFVQPDNFQGGILSGTLLLEKGHRNIYYISGDITVAAGRVHFNQRYNGLCVAFEMAELAHPGLVRWHIKNSESRYEVTQLLEKVKAKAPGAPTALVIGNKVMASEISMVAVGMGIRIPEDLSIISFIDRELHRDDNISNIDFSRKAMAQQLISTILDGRYSRSAINNNKHLLPMFLSNSCTIKDLN